MVLIPSGVEVTSPVKTYFIFIICVVSWFRAYFSSLSLESCFNILVFPPKYALKYGVFSAWAPFSQCCFDLLIRSVSFINQVGENHDVEKCSNRKQICSKIKGLVSTAAYCTDNQKAFYSQI